MAKKLAILLLLLASSLSAQNAPPPSADWRTIETAHFRVHYPSELEEWATRAAGRLESIRNAVVAEVGFAPPQRTDVIVANPTASFNGSALPFLDAPRMTLGVESPGPEEQFGAYTHWAELVTVHEVTHLMHMLRPVRHPLGRIVDNVIPAGPIMFGAPRWVTEGYATVIEGRLMGGGRPGSTMRALILRRWAATGQLPTYKQLQSDTRFLGMRMAYYAGSAYLEWLEQRSGRESLRNLWRRLTSRERPDFDKAFADVFGDSPERLYGQFVAELTASAMSIERSTPYREGELFQETTRGSGDPAVSPDGKQLAIALRKQNEPDQLVIWSTGAPEEEERKYNERVDKLLQRDPEDVRPVRAKPLARKKVHTLTMPDGGSIDTPRWTRDGKAIVFAHRVADEDGMLHHELYRWDFDNVTRITHQGDVRDADPLPDGRTALAVRSRHGKTQLAEVDLTSGAITERTPLSLDITRSHPRVSPDGKRIAHVAHVEGAWKLFIDERAIELPGEPASPEWSSNDELVLTVFARGFAELHRVRIDGTSTQLTVTAGGAFEPSPASDGRIFFMSLDPNGFVTRVLPNAEAVTATRTYDAALVPALPPSMGTATVFENANVTPRPYGIGRQEFSWFTGASFAPEHQALELGVRFGDVIGRFDTLLIGSLARKDAPEGIALASAYRGWPVELHAHAFDVENDNGIELRASWSRLFSNTRITLDAGALSDDLLFASGAISSFQRFGPNARISESLRFEADEDHTRTIGEAAFTAGVLSLGARYQRDQGTTITLGGLASSVLPRSAYAHRVIDPALPLAISSGDDYESWRVNLGLDPVTGFYQRHEIDGTRITVAGVEWMLDFDAFPLLQFPGINVSAGAARVLDSPLEGDTRWWFSMRWRP